eukprot:TRINITY_DN91930_c0_g1_i1.p1 TRINITY_DN91930_c0_g1~~TRINITY_DN91930_c0_g1_i1.p1  ORF type:complete len:679 (-),score=120.82 TRINITY_DN91930_c0_g1_i1:533-2422(-)
MDMVDDSAVAHEPSSSRRKSKVTGKFITGEGEQFTSEDLLAREASCPKCRVRARRVLSNTVTEIFSGCIVLLDVCMTWLSIDNRSLGHESPEWMDAAGNMCLGWYTIEFSLWLFVLSWRVIESKWLLLDLAFLVTGFAELLLTGLNLQVDAMNILRMLRIMRILRLTKMLRKFMIFRELRKLLLMTASCLKTLVWSFIFCFIIMCCFSMIIVELVGPTIKQLTENGLWADCEQVCPPMDTVMDVNLALFSTVIAGDSWGRMAVPIIREVWWTSLVFIGAQLTIVFGVLNLIVAVVVDTFAEQREQDVDAIATEMQETEELDLQFLHRIFLKIDEDQSGELTLQELIEGAKKVPEFQARLRVMDIDSQDLEQLFYMLDSDQGGSIDPTEFNLALSRWLHESKTATRFVKFNVERVLQEQDNIKDMLGEFRKYMQKLDRKTQALAEANTRLIQKVIQDRMPQSCSEKSSGLSERSASPRSSSDGNSLECRSYGIDNQYDVQAHSPSPASPTSNALRLTAASLQHAGLAKDKREAILKSSLQHLEDLVRDILPMVSAQDEPAQRNISRPATGALPVQQSRAVRLSSAKWRSDDSETAAKTVETLVEGPQAEHPQNRDGNHGAEGLPWERVRV